ncbi:hypothetical protein [Emticicia sp. SJ17W-69]|uniref:hypothetical protein n=1 Tax=Emticicia sp. SJ17W-69 TaxID=3421657 RepID=UPI003EB9AB22
MKARFFLFYVFLTNINPCFCQKNDGITVETSQKYFIGAIKYLVQSQSDTTIQGKQYQGEWEVFMELTEPFFFLGLKQKKRDSNCFTISAIHNFLAEMYIADTTLQLLKPTISKAFKEIQSFRNNQRFNFWKALPPQRDLKLGKEPQPIQLVRRPTNFILKSRFVGKTTNVADDADDTSLGNLASLYHNKIFEDTLSLISSKSYDEYIDLNRKNRNWFNILFHGLPNSGAFLTWHWTEHQFKYWNKLRSALNGAFVFVPISPSYPKAYKPWIPFGANEVDVVVNANVLTYLAMTDQLDKSAGKKGAIFVINELLKRERWENTAIYYPNSFHIHYAVARAYAAGLTELKISCETILAHLLHSQKSDGSFASSLWLNHGDLIQSTAYALHALLDLQSKGMKVPKTCIEKAIAYLLSNAKFEDNKVSWSGGVYFSGGTFVRGIMVWKSDAYTTAMIAKCLQKWMFLTK